MSISLPEGGLVIGVGIDLVEIDRVRRSVERHGNHFIDKVFTAEEKAYCLDMSDSAPSFAARFAVKEAVSKAFTTGIGGEFSLHSVSVSKGDRGQPIAILDEQAKALLKEVGGSDVLISITHTRENAQAIALIVKKI